MAKAATVYRWTGEYSPSSTGAFLVVAASNAQDSFTVIVDGKKVLSSEAHEGREVNKTASVDLQANVLAKIEVDYATKSSAPHVGLGICAASEALPEPSRAVLRNADAVLVTAGFGPDSEGEGSDRTYEMPDRKNELIEQVAALNPHTIVAVSTGGAVETAPWLDKVAALIHDYYPGQEGARALAEVVFGERSPSGHLPFSWERTMAEDPTSAHYDEEGSSKDSHYAEGLYVGYRYYTSMHKQPLFPFGFGLSYTEFALSGLTVKVTTAPASSSTCPQSRSAPTAKPSSVKPTSKQSRASPLPTPAASTPDSPSAPTCRSFPPTTGASSTTPTPASTPLTPTRTASPPASSSASPSPGIRHARQHSRTTTSPTHTRTFGSSDRLGATTGATHLIGKRRTPHLLIDYATIR